MKMPPLSVARALTWIALLASAALLADALQPGGAFCGPGGGCAAVRESAFSHIPLGSHKVPLPVFGCLALGLYLGISTLPSQQVRLRLGAPLGYLMATAGLALLGIQLFVLGTLCPYCVVVDTITVLLGVGQLALGTRFWDSPPPGQDLSAGAWAALAALGFLGPVLYPKLVPDESESAELRALSQPGKVTIVEFFDYECPHCRHLGPRLTALAKQEDVRLLRGYVPLRSHMHAKRAAEYGICLEEQGGERQEHFDLLALTGPLEENDLARYATTAGADAAALASCLSSKRPAERLKRDRELIERAGFRGLPTTFVEGHRIEGARATEMYQDAIERARRGKSRIPMGIVYWASLALIAIAIALSGRAAAAPVSSTES
jgi:uncharacterized membrane protein/thiol-disulfide isomerase/thioredoxin